MKRVTSTDDSEVEDPDNEHPDGGGDGTSGANGSTGGDGTSGTTSGDGTSGSTGGDDGGIVVPNNPDDVIE